MLITCVLVPRPFCCRRVETPLEACWFVPAGRPMGEFQQVQLTFDELEALRLSSLEGLYQQEVAERMGVSRATVGRILEAAHRKIADALVSGKALRIEGGPVATTHDCPRRCPSCRRRRDCHPQGACPCGRPADSHPGE